jgi:hypothetical protein
MSIALQERGIDIRKYSGEPRNRLPQTRAFIPASDGYTPYQDRGVASTVLREQLDQVLTLQDQWDTGLGIRRRRPGEFSNYNPVLARWNFERVQTLQEEEIFRAHELQNIKTAMRERNHSKKSELALFIDADNKIRADVHTHEPWEDVIERGRMHRLEGGSNETEREQAELDGFQRVQAGLTRSDAEIGTAYLVISPPGKDGGPYPDNYVDFYELAQDPKTQERYIKYTRFISPLDHEQTRAAITNLDSSYFADQQGSLDAWYLAHPLRIDAGRYKDTDRCFDDLFGTEVRAMEEQTFQELWKIYTPAALHFLDVLTQPEFDPVAVARAWNTVLLSTENQELTDKMKEVTLYVSADGLRLNPRARRAMGAAVGEYGSMQAKKIKAGCGSSESTSMTDNSVSQFSFGKDKYGSRSFDCPDCGRQNERGENELLSACQHCDSTKVAC